MADDTPNPEPVAEAPKRRGLLLALAAVVPAALGAWLAVSQPASIGSLFGAEAAATEAPAEPAAEPVEYGAFSEIQGLIVNPAGTEGLRYLMVNVGFESAKPKVLEEVTTKEVAVRDAILKILSEKTVPQLADIALRDSLKIEIRDTVNVILSDGQVDRLYFTQYVLQ
jgi:flagellar FliL protein